MKIVVSIGSKKERTPKLEYLITRSQLTGPGSVGIRSGLEDCKSLHGKWLFFTKASINKMVVKGSPGSGCVFLAFLKLYPVAEQKLLYFE